MITTLIRVFGSLGIVLALMFLLRFYLLRRMPTGLLPKAATLRVRERIWLSSRTQVAVVDLVDKSFLVCANDHAIQIVPLPEQPPLVATQESGPDFARHIAQIMGTWHKGGKNDVPHS